MTTKLHIGCLDQPIAGWVNTDITPHITVARVPGLATLLHRIGKLSHHRLQQHKQGVFKQVRRLDVSKRFPFDDGSVTAIFSAHMLEHLPPAIADNCMRECYRVLAPGGVMRTGVPDLDHWIGRYDASDPDAFVEAVFETKANAGKNRHYWMYNANSLTAAFRRIGFDTVERRAYREGICPDLDELDNRPAETLFVEAVK